MFFPHRSLPVAHKGQKSRRGHDRRALTRWTVTRELLFPGNDDGHLPSVWNPNTPTTKFLPSVWDRSSPTPLRLANRQVAAGAERFSLPNPNSQRCCSRHIIRRCESNQRDAPRATNGRPDRGAEANRALVFLGGIGGSAQLGEWSDSHRGGHRADGLRERIFPNEIRRPLCGDRRNALRRGHFSCLFS